jgi:hypothetical protein
MRSEPNLFILGPSGAGKTRLGRYIAKARKYLHLEIDRYPDGDGIDLENLRHVWDPFFEQGDVAALASALCARAASSGRPACVLTFPSGLVLSSLHIAAAADHNILVRYLYGSAADCLASFIKRERESVRNLPVQHWFANNACAYLDISTAEFARHRVIAFGNGGKHLKLAALAAAMLGTA